MLIFQEGTMKAICFHAKAEYPKECCGVMLGRRMGDQRIVCRVIQTGNKMDNDKNGMHFLIDPLEIMKIELVAEEQGLEIIGFYHSHPDYEAVVSSEDMIYMIAGYSYSIISMKEGTDVAVKSFEKISQTDNAAKEEILIEEK